MSDSEYDAYDGRGTRPLDVGKILKGDGWDEIGSNKIYSDVDLDEDELDDGVMVSRGSCTCNTDAISTAANALVQFFVEHPDRIPRSDVALESFNTPVPRLYGPWTRYVNVASSFPLTKDGDASIHLYGCPVPGHNLHVVIEDDLVPYIKGQKAAITYAEVVRNTYETSSNTSEEIDEDDWVDEDLVEAVEAEEERRYDERTFGELDPEVESEGNDDEDDVAKEWQELTFPAVAVNAFVEQGLELEQVLQLARYMPLDEAINWVDVFKLDSMVALGFLRIGLGNSSHFKVLEGINYDELRSSIATAIREAIFRQFDKYQNQILILDEEDEEDEQDLDNEDFGWDDDDDDE